MRSAVSSFVVGIIFAIGLGLSGMTLPERVVGFLDVFGNWNPSLIFVMVGAILVYALLAVGILKRQAPLFSAHWHLPNRRDISPQLVIGAILFGVGWGLAGYCPAPAITALASFSKEPLIFVIAMAAGMLLFRRVQTFLPWKS